MSTDITKCRTTELSGFTPRSEGICGPGPQLNLIGCPGLELPGTRPGRGLSCSGLRREEPLPGDHGEIALVGEQTVDPCPEETQLLVDGPAV